MTPEKAPSATRTTLMLTDPVPAVNAIGTQNCGPINSGPTRCRLLVYVDWVAKSEKSPVSKLDIQPECGE